MCTVEPISLLVNVTKIPSGRIHDIKNRHFVEQPICGDRRVDREVWRSSCRVGGIFLNGVDGLDGSAEVLPEVGGYIGVLPVVPYLVDHLKEYSIHKAGRRDGGG